MQWLRSRVAVASLVDATSKNLGRADALNFTLEIGAEVNATLSGSA